MSMHRSNQRILVGRNIKYVVKKWCIDQIEKYFDTSFKLCLYDLRVSPCKFKHVLQA